MLFILKLKENDRALFIHIGALDPSYIRLNTVYCMMREGLKCKYCTYIPIFIGEIRLPIVIKKIERLIRTRTFEWYLLRWRLSATYHLMRTTLIGNVIKFHSVSKPR